MCQWPRLAVPHYPEELKTFKLKTGAPQFGDDWSESDRLDTCSIERAAGALCLISSKSGVIFFASGVLH